MRKTENFVEGVDFCCLEGSTKEVDRKKLINEFNKRGSKLRVFLISIKAGGEGINLHGANRCIIMDVSWNPAEDRQAIFRIYRLGQTKPCFIYRLIAMVSGLLTCYVFLYTFDNI